MLWKFSKNGEFSTKSAYRIANQSENNVVQFSGQWIWKLDIVPKIINFLWLCLHGSIPVKEVLAGRGINCDALCPLCREQNESILHLLRDCVFARNLWHKLEVPPTHVLSFTDGLEAWLKANCLSEVRHKGGIPWCTLFLYTVWSLWRNRNSVVFENSVPNSTLEKICLSQAKEFHFCVSKVNQAAPRIWIPIKWSKPPHGWCKLNTDGASFGNPGKAGGGGLIRDSEGRWLKGFSRAIGHTTSVVAELWAVRDGLNLAIQLGISCLEVELDAKIVVELLENNDSTNFKFSPVLHDCRYLLTRFTQVRVAHVYREVNRCADFLAKHGCCLRVDFAMYDTPPSVELDRLLLADVNGLYYYRQIASTLASVATL